MEKKNKIRVHRVGSVTAGLSMISFGILFLLHLLLNIISYDLIFNLWPLMLIGLGIELLISSFSERKMIYDKGAVVILLLMAVLAVGMAAADVCVELSRNYWAVEIL